jgi:CRP-like cAMP-binding protein
MIFYDLFRDSPKMIKLPAGKSLFSEGDPGNGLMYVLVDGRARVMLGNRVLEEAGQGSIFGEMAVIDDLPRSTTVVTDTECTFAEIDRKRFRYLVEEAPHFAIEVMKVLSRRLRQCDLSLAKVAAGK